MMASTANPEADQEIPKGPEAQTKTEVKTGQVEVGAEAVDQKKADTTTAVKKDAEAVKADAQADLEVVAKSADMNPMQVTELRRSTHVDDEVAAVGGEVNTLATATETQIAGVGIETGTEATAQTETAVTAGAQTEAHIADADAGEPAPPLAGADQLAGSTVAETGPVAATAAEAQAQTGLAEASTAEAAPTGSAADQVSAADGLTQANEVIAGLGGNGSQSPEAGISEAPDDTEATEAAEATEGDANETGEAKEKMTEKETIIDGAAKKRTSRLGRYFEGKVVLSEIANLLPILGGLKMAAEGAVGETLDGQELSGNERALHFALGLGGAVLDAIPVAGEVAMAGRAARGLVKLAEASPKLERGARAALRYMERNPQVVEKAEKAAQVTYEKGVKAAKAYRGVERRDEKNDRQEAAQAEPVPTEQNNEETAQ